MMFTFQFCKVVLPYFLLICYWHPVGHLLLSMHHCSLLYTKWENRLWHLR